MDGQNTSTPAPEKKSSAGPMIAIIGLIVIVVAGIIGYQSMNKTQTANTTTTQQTAQPTTADAKDEEPAAMKQEETAGEYKDGTYTAVGNYTSPGGAEELGVTLTIAKGVVTDSEVEVKATRPMSKTRQTDFAEHYKDMVVGKNIDELSLGKVSGSSLSPKGFNDAVTKIKEEATQS